MPYFGDFSFQEQERGWKIEVDENESPFLAGDGTGPGALSGSGLAGIDQVASLRARGRPGAAVCWEEDSLLEGFGPWAGEQAE